MNLLRSIREGDVVGVRRAIEHGEDIHGKSESGHPILTFAAAVSTHAVVEELLNLGLDPNEESPVTREAPLFFAARNQHGSKVIDLLIRRGALVDARNGLMRTPLIEAASHSLAMNVQAFIDSGANLGAESSQNETAASFAIVNNDLDILQALLAAGLNPNAIFGDSWTLLKLAVFERRDEMSEILLKFGANRDDLEFPYRH